MTLQLSKFPRPFTAVGLVCAEHVQIFESSIEGVLTHEGEIRRITERAVLSVRFDLFDTLSTELVATAAVDTRLFQDLEAHGTFCLNMDWRRAYERTVIPTASFSVPLRREG